MEDCIDCPVCESVCPNEAILEHDFYYVIDPKLCTECVGFYEKPQSLDVCPVQCIVSDLEHVESKAELLKKKETIHHV
jgi:ferredoxin